MDDLDLLTLSELRVIANQFNLEGRTKRQLTESIRTHYFELKKYMSYKYVCQLGREGKDGRTFLARNEQGEEFAIKIFRPGKSRSSILQEVTLQQQAAAAMIAPRVIEYDVDGKFIVMEKLDQTLYDLFVEQGGILSRSQQRSIIHLFKKLDKCDVFHADPNPLNFMRRGSKWFVIDFGFAMQIDSKCISKYGKNPNMKYMPTGIMLKFKQVDPKSKLSYVEQYV